MYERKTYGPVLMMMMITVSDSGRSDHSGVRAFRSMLLSSFPGIEKKASDNSPCSIHNQSGVSDHLLITRTFSSVSAMFIQHVRSYTRVEQIGSIFCPHLFSSSKQCVRALQKNKS
jgi:hypothetical protein